MVDGAVLGMAINAMVGKTDLENSKNVASTEKTKKQIVQTLSAEEMEEMKSNKNFKVEGTKVIISETKGGLDDLKGVLLAQANSPKVMSDVGKNLIGQVEEHVEQLSEDKKEEIMSKFESLNSMGKFTNKGAYLLYKGHLKSLVLTKINDADYDRIIDKYNSLVTGTRFSEEEKTQIYLSCFFYYTCNTFAAKRYLTGADTFTVKDITKSLEGYVKEVVELGERVDRIEKMRQENEQIRKENEQIRKENEQLSEYLPKLVSFVKGEIHMKKEEVLDLVDKVDKIDNKSTGDKNSDEIIKTSWNMIKSKVLQKLGER